LQDFPIQKITADNSAFPEQLKNIASSPRELFFRGELSKQNDKLFAVVGTRLCSDYGKEIAFSIAKDLSRAGLIIVSGMALGIDSWAHKGALEGGGQTIAVLGTGLDEKSIYPRENLKLARQILEKGGCLISEYPPEHPAAKFAFLERNRIIAGISEGVLVVEAKIKSGALNTAGWARKQGKKVFAVPGSVFSQNSKGCHLLIKQGARLTENANDILRELGLSSLASHQPAAANPDEGLILNALRQGALSIDKIIEITKLPAQKVSVNISIMEIDNKVKNLGANIYALTR